MDPIVILVREGRFRWAFEVYWPDKATGVMGFRRTRRSALAAITRHTHNPPRQRPSEG